MPEYSMDLNMIRVSNKKFLKKAEKCRPELGECKVSPVRIAEIVYKEDKTYPEAVTRDSIERLSEYHLKKGDKICLDFADHQVGYVTFDMASVGSPQDSPAYIRIKFGEIAKELTERSEDYNGWISRSWIQEEYIHIDVLPISIELPRRYAFRYLEIEVLDTSAKWQLQIRDVSCRSVSAVNGIDAEPFACDDKLIQKIDEVSLRTLRNCMQSVFEDGPKRDRRLWLGDLRLQALVNYATFRQYDLVKRCLYLFAGQTRRDGQVSACMYIEPCVIADDTFLLDYSMFFGVILLDYYRASGDRETLEELSQCAYRQMEIAKEQFDRADRLIPGHGFWGFIDWTEGLDKQAAMQGVYIYSAKRVGEIAEILGDEEKARELYTEAQKKTDAARKYFLDQISGLFVSGEERQINYASQVWMILSGAVSPEEGREILRRLKEAAPEKKMVSPYMNHHFVEALLVCGEKEEALEYIKTYWGGMVRHGADTFWELYNPDDPAESPYGSSIVNSYCHAWSCTPAYLFRQYFTAATEETNEYR